MEKQINEKIIEMDREYPFLFCFKSDFWMEIPDDKVNSFENTKRQAVIDNSGDFEDTKRQTPKMTFVYVLR